MGVAEAERLREITCGLLANVCAHRSLRRQVIEDPSLAQELLRAFHTTDDPVCLTEVLRLLSTAAMAAPAAVTPEIQLVSKSAVESAATSVPEMAAESAAAELTTKSAAMELATESAATELATESAATAMTTELAAESESAAKLGPELAAESVVEYTTAMESVAELASESAAELASESAAESAAKSMPESAVESATTKLATELTSESAAESASESAAAAKMTTESSAAVAAAAEVVGLAPAMATVETLERLGFFLESCLEEKLLSRACSLAHTIMYRHGDIVIRPLVEAFRLEESLALLLETRSSDLSYEQLGSAETGLDALLRCLEMLSTSELSSIGPSPPHPPIPNATPVSNDVAVAVATSGVSAVTSARGSVMRGLVKALMPWEHSRRSQRAALLVLGNILGNVLQETTAGDVGDLRDSGDARLS
ncbi:unnamed protein product, partial [Laminaria digitata]